MTQGEIQSEATIRVDSPKVAVKRKLSAIEQLQH
jgi:hypothetical protein